MRTCCRCKTRKSKDKMILHRRRGGVFCEPCLSAIGVEQKGIVDGIIHTPTGLLEVIKGIPYFTKRSLGMLRK